MEVRRGAKDGEAAASGRPFQNSSVDGAGPRISHVRSINTTAEAAVPVDRPRVRSINGPDDFVGAVNHRVGVQGIIAAHTYILGELQSDRVDTRIDEIVARESASADAELRRDELMDSALGAEETLRVEIGGLTEELATTDTAIVGGAEHYQSTLDRTAALSERMTGHLGRMSEDHPRYGKTADTASTLGHVSRRLSELPNHVAGLSEAVEASRNGESQDRIPADNVSVPTSAAGDVSIPRGEIATNTSDAGVAPPATDSLPLSGREIVEQAATGTKDAAVSVRVQPDDRDLIETVAAYTGLSVSEFMRVTSLGRVATTLDEHGADAVLGAHRAKQEGTTASPDASDKIADPAPRTSPVTEPTADVSPAPQAEPVTNAQADTVSGTETTAVTDTTPEVTGAVAHVNTDAANGIAVTTGAVAPASADAVDASSANGDAAAGDETPAEETSSGLLPLSEVKLLPAHQRTIEALRDSAMTPEELADAIVTPTSDPNVGAEQRGGAAISVTRALLERRGADHRIIRTEDGKYTLTSVTSEDVVDAQQVTPRHVGVGLESPFKEERDAARIKEYIDEFGPAQKTSLRDSLGLSQGQYDSAISWLEEDGVLNISDSEARGPGGKPLQLIGLRSDREIVLDAFAAGAASIDGLAERTRMDKERFQTIFDELLSADVIEATDRVTDPITQKPVYLFGIATPEESADTANDASSAVVSDVAGDIITVGTSDIGTTASPTGSGVSESTGSNAAALAESAVDSVVAPAVESAPEAPVATGPILRTDADGDFWAAAADAPLVLPDEARLVVAAIDGGAGSIADVQNRTGLSQWKVREGIGLANGVLGEHGINISTQVATGRVELSGPASVLPPAAEATDVSAEPVPAETAKTGPKLLETFTHDGETIEGKEGAMLAALDPFGVRPVVKQDDLITAVNGKSAYDLGGLKETRAWLKEHGLEMRLINNGHRGERGRIVEPIRDGSVKISVVGEHVVVNGEKVPLEDSEREILTQFAFGIHENELARRLSVDDSLDTAAVSEAVAALNASLGEKIGSSNAIAEREDTEFGRYYVTEAVDVKVIAHHGPVAQSRIDALGSYLQGAPTEDIFANLGMMKGATPRPYGKAQGYMALQPAIPRIINRGRSGISDTEAAEGHLSEAKVYTLLEERVGVGQPDGEHAREREFLSEFATDLGINASPASIKKAAERISTDPESIRALFVPEAVTEISADAPAAGLAPEGDIFPTSDVIVDATTAPVRPSPGMMPRNIAHLGEAVKRYDPSEDTGRWIERQAASELPSQREQRAAESEPVPHVEAAPLTAEDVVGEIEVAYQRLHDARVVRMDAPGTFLTRNSLARVQNRLAAGGIDLTAEALRGYIGHNLISRYEGTGGGMRARNDSTNRFEVTAADVATAMVLEQFGERIPEDLQRNLLAEAKRVRDDLEKQQKGRSMRADGGDDRGRGGRESESVRVRRGSTERSGRGRRNRR